MTHNRDPRWDVAVVIPTYNRAHLIGDTLDSVLAQTCAPAEIIVVDDGSTDDTPEVVRAYGGRVRYHRIANSGVCHARNVGVRMTNAPWIALCDSDDLWRPEKLERQMTLFRQAPGVEYGFCDFVILGDRGCESETKFERSPEGYWDGARKIDDDMWILDVPLYERLLTYHPIFPSTVVMGRDFFERVGGFDERWGRTVGEDVEFTLRCVQHAPAGVIAKPVVGIRKHRGNFSDDLLGGALGLIEIYRHARTHHRPMGELFGAQLEDLIAIETRNAIEFAFSAGRIDIVRELRRTRRIGSSGKMQLKLAVSRLPRPLAHPLCRAFVYGREALAR